MHTRARARRSNAARCARAARRWAGRHSVAAPAANAAPTIRQPIAHRTAGPPLRGFPGSKSRRAASSAGKSCALRQSPQRRQRGGSRHPRVQRADARKFLEQFLPRVARREFRGRQRLGSRPAATLEQASPVARPLPRRLRPWPAHALARGTPAHCQLRRRSGRDSRAHRPSRPARGFRRATRVRMMRAPATTRESKANAAARLPRRVRAAPAQAS